MKFITSILTIYSIISQLSCRLKDNKYKSVHNYWFNATADTSGMLAGFTETHKPDIETSISVLDEIIKTEKINPNYAIDTCAGIGRVTQSVIQKFFKNVDIMEQEDKFINQAKINFKNNSHVKDYYQSSLQDFKFPKKYDLIWLQWCLENLNDEDMLNYLIKSKKALNNNGVVIIKENSSLHTVDNPRVIKYRTPQKIEEFISKSGLKIVKKVNQPNWPSSLMPVVIWVLKNK